MVALNDLGLPVGFSDHSRPDLDGLLATKFSLTLGAKAVERHFTVLAKNETKDGPVSINEAEGKEISEFAAMNLVDKVANLGPGINRLGEFFAIRSLQPTDVEILNSSYYRGRVASIIKGKVIFSWENI
jgi:sialic acid synthase SpsE